MALWFWLAGIGMLLGQLVYMTGQKHLIHIGNLLTKTENQKKKKSITNHLQN